MKAKSALVLHYNPIVLYPPAKSGVRFLEQNGFDVKVVTTQDASIQSISKLLLFLRILWFNLRATIRMVRGSIDLLVVYEHFSILTVRLCRVLHPNCKVWLHFHEYSSPLEVRKSGCYSRYCWSRVANLIKDVSLYTHTNVWRLSQFQKDFDCDIYCIQNGRFIPNTPPRSWIHKAASNRKEVQCEKGPLRLVYHGAVHSKTTHILELYRLLINSPGKYKLDIYSRDEIIEGYNEDVEWHDSIPFQELALILPTYDVGLILYKGHIPNYVHNVPNKFWEYRAAKLGVIVPSEMNVTLFPESHREKVAVIDFHECSANQFDQIIEGLLETEFVQDSVPPIEFYLHDILALLESEMRIKR